MARDISRCTPTRRRSEQDHTRTLNARPAGDSVLNRSFFLGLAREAARGEVTRVRRPLEADDPFQVSYVRPYGLSRNGTVFLDPYRGTILNIGGVESGRRQSAFMLWSHQLHYGEYGGVYSKALYTAVGLLPFGLFLTGLTLWARKKISRSRKLAAFGTEIHSARLAEVGAPAMATSESSGPG